MEKFSSRKDAIHLVKMQGVSSAMLWLVKEQLDNAEAELLGCNPQDPQMRDKLVKAQTLRNLHTTFTTDLK